MSTKGSHAVEVVDELLTMLSDALPEDDKGDLEIHASLIRTLLLPEDDFSVESFVADEVARALDD